MEPISYRPNATIASVFAYSWYKYETNEGHDFDIEITNPHYRHNILLPLAAGAITGGVAKAVIAPLDRVKINFQVVNKPFTLRAAAQFMLNSYRVAGLRSLWRGNSAAVAHIVPYDAIQFIAHESWEYVFHHRTKTTRYKCSPATAFFAGSIAGVISITLTYPLDLVRARMAVTHRNVYSNLVHVFVMCWKLEGVAAFYRGYSATILSVIPFSAGGYLTYEALKLFYHDRVTDKTISPAGRMIFGTVSGLIGQSAAYPLDVVRRRMQTSFIRNTYCDSIWGAIATIAKEEGFRRGLYKGLSLSWIKGPIAVGVTFGVFDIVKEFLEKSSFFADV